MSYLRNDKTIYVIAILFLIVKLFTLSYYDIVWWDSAVYIGMGKHIFGDSGLWEDSRPIVWPLMLGFLWKTGFNVILFGRILEIILGSLVILMTYIIGKKISNKKIALLASIFLAFSPTFFFFNGVMLTGIVSTFFSLTGIYFFIGRKYIISGLLLGIAFMARFLQLFVFSSALLVALIYLNRVKIENLIRLVMGFAASTAPFLIFNHIMYNNELFPLFQQFLLSSNSGWFNFQPVNFYFIQLFRENFLYLMFAPGIILMLRMKNISRITIVGIFLLFFIFFNLIKQKEMRFLILLLPYIYLLASYSIFFIADKLKNNYAKKTIFVIVGASIAFSLINISTLYKNELNKFDKYKILQDQFEADEISGDLWVSSPVIPVFSDKKISKLMYYPFFNQEKNEELVKESYDADFIFLDSCDLACRPSDIGCESDKTELIDYFKSEFSILYESGDGCEQFVFGK